MTAPPPTALANLHWSRTGRFSSIPLAPYGDRPVGRFVMIAIEEARLPGRDEEALFDRAIELLLGGMGAWRGGLLRNRPSSWNGRADLGWMYRELPQSIPKGSLEGWTGPQDVPLQVSLEA